ncbi:MAG TPA: hypothetical protein VIK03_02460 [Thermoleophilia bacterium]|jgi:hypothetical protein
MTSDYRLPPQRGSTAAASSETYSRDEILVVERWAWAGKVGYGRTGFFYDGIDFWKQNQRDGAHAVAPAKTPVRGWRHKPTCNCPLCDARSRAADVRAAGDVPHPAPPTL